MVLSGIINMFKKYFLYWLYIYQRDKNDVFNCQYFKSNDL